MATSNQKDIQLLFLGGVATKTTGGIDTLNVAEIGLFTPAGTRLTEATAATATEFIIVQDRGTGELVVSGTIKKANIVTAIRKTHDAATEQVNYIGSNGTAGSINLINDNEYHVRISIREGLTSNHGGLYLKHGWFNSDASTSQSEVSIGMTGSLVQNFRKEADSMIAFAAITDEATAAAYDFDETASFTNGSKWFSVATDIDYNAGTQVVVGDFVRVGATATSAVAVTSDTYEILEISGLNIRVDRPIQVASGARVTGSSYTQVITVAQGAAANWGISLTGVAAKFTVGKFLYTKISWDLSIENFGTTQFTNPTAATEGTGNEAQVAEMEWFLQGNEGEFFRKGEPNIFPQRADTSGDYDLIDLIYEEIYTGSIVSGPIRKVHTFATPETTPNYALSATADDITDVLEVLVFGTANGDLSLG